jgi:hypothetical protein
VQYMLLIYSNELPENEPSPEQRAQMFQEYGRFTQELQESGAMVDGRPLESSATATTVQVRDGERLVTDGPYAETKEQLGGFYIVETETLDDALDWAAKIPGARNGTIEVRPVMPVPQEAVRA